MRWNLRKVAAVNTVANMVRWESWGRLHLSPPGLISPEVLPVLPLKPLGPQHSLRLSWFQASSLHHGITALDFKSISAFITTSLILRHNLRGLHGTRGPKSSIRAGRLAGQISIKALPFPTHARASAVAVHASTPGSSRLLQTFPATGAQRAPALSPLPLLMLFIQFVQNDGSFY